MFGGLAATVMQIIICITCDCDANKAISSQKVMKTQIVWQTSVAVIHAFSSLSSYIFRPPYKLHHCITSASPICKLASSDRYCWWIEHLFVTRLTMFDECLMHDATCQECINVASFSDTALCVMRIWQIFRGWNPTIVMHSWQRHIQCIFWQIWQNLH